MAIQPDSGLTPNMHERLAETPNISRRLQMLQEIVVKIDTAASREEIFGILRTDLARLLKYDLCMAALLNKARSHYIISALSAVADASELAHKHFTLEEGMPGWVIRTGASIIGDIGTGPVFHQGIEGKLQDLGIQALLLVPMRTGDKVAGCLVFGSTRASNFNEEDAAVMQIFAASLAMALAHSAVVEDARKHITQIELINNVTRQITSTLQLEELLSAAASTIQKTFSYFDVTVFLLSEDRKELVLEAHSGSFVDFLPHGYRQKVEEGVMGWVVRNGEKILCNDVSQDPRYVAYAYHNTKSELALPIVVDGVTIGVLNVEDTKLHAFDESDAIVLETLSDQLGIAIKNARLYEEVRTANMRLIEVDQMKSDFLGIVSHDFRSPLASVILAGKALLKNEDVLKNARLKEYITIIVEQANRLNLLAEDTLSITKIESGQMNYFFKVVNVERLIQDAVSMVRLTNKHTLECKPDPSVPFIKGDQTKLRQVVQNLVNNAVKYSPRGGKVTVLVQDYSPAQIMISVTDEGIGIPGAEQEKLFKKFSRIESGETKDIKGAGLGLWICREVVEAHGGKIWIESQPGKGTTVRLTLNKAQ